MRKIYRYSRWTSFGLTTALAISIGLNLGFPNETVDPVIRLIKAAFTPNLYLTITSWAVTVFGYIMNR